MIYVDGETEPDLGRGHHLHNIIGPCPGVRHGQSLGTLILSRIQRQLDESTLFPVAFGLLQRPCLINGMLRLKSLLVLSASLVIPASAESHIIEFINK